MKGARRALGARRAFKDRPKTAVQRSSRVKLMVRRQPEARAGKRLCDSWHSDEPPCSSLEVREARRGLERGQGTAFRLWLVAIDGGGLATPGIILRIWPGAVRPGRRVFPIQRAATDPRDIRSRSRHWRRIPPSEQSRRLRDPPMRRGKIIRLARAYPVQMKSSEPDKQARSHMFRARRALEPVSTSSCRAPRAGMRTWGWMPHGVRMR